MLELSDGLRVEGRGHSESGTDAGSAEESREGLSTQDVPRRLGERKCNEDFLIVACHIGEVVFTLSAVGGGRRWDAFGSVDRTRDRCAMVTAVDPGLSNPRIRVSRRLAVAGRVVREPGVLSARWT